MAFLRNERLRVPQINRVLYLSGPSLEWSLCQDYEKCWFESLLYLALTPKTQLSLSRYNVQLTVATSGDILCAHKPYLPFSNGEPNLFIIATSAVTAELLGSAANVYDDKLGYRVQIPNLISQPFLAKYKLHNCKPDTFEYWLRTYEQEVQILLEESMRSAMPLLHFLMHKKLAQQRPFILKSFTHVL